jgi:hypothetical protein
MTDQEMKDRLTVALEEVCKNNNIDIVTGKKLLLGHKQAMTGWIENTKILLEEDQSLVDDDYFMRSAAAVKKMIG